MKKAIFAVIASMFVFASVHAAETTTTTTTTMSHEECEKALADCKDDACKAALAEKGCKPADKK